MVLSKPFLRIIGAICFLALLNASVCSAEPTWINPSYGPWHSATIGGGGYLQDVILCPSDPKRVYAYGDMCGAFRSDDGGATWRMIHGTLPTSAGNYEFSGLLVDPRNADKIIVATGSQWAREGIYVSNDGGGAWTKTLTAAWSGNGPHRNYGFHLARSPKTPNLILAASLGTGVWRSEDNGKTWTDCGAKDLFTSDIRFDTQNPEKAYLCAVANSDSNFSISGVKLLGGFYRSDDAGKSWTKASDQSPSEIVQSQSAPHEFYGIFGGKTVMRSADSCSTWQPCSDGLPSMTGDEIEALGAGPNFILVATYQKGSFYRLNAGSSTWLPVVRSSWDLSENRLSTPPYGMATGSITVDPRDASHWYSTDFMGIDQTWDDGKTMKPTNMGIETTVIHAITPDVVNSSMVYMGMADGGGWWSDDMGKTFHAVTIPNGGSNIKMISQSPVDPNIVYEVGSNGYGDWTSNQIFVSSDRGRHFSRVPMTGTGLPPGWLTCDSIIADPNDAKTVYVTNSHPIGVNDGGVYKSVDGGQSWTWMSQGMPTGAWYFQSNIWVHGPELAMSPDGSLIAISNQSGLVFRFDQADKTWKQSQTGLTGTYYSVVADSLKPGRYYLAAAYSGLYRTDDSGTTWQKIYNGSVQYAAADPHVAGRVAAGTADGVVISADSGAHWQLLNKSLPYRMYDRVGFAGNHLLVGTGGSGMFWYDL